MPQQNMGMYGVPQQHGLNNQGGMQQQPMMNNQGGMQQQPMMNNQSGMPQGGMPQGGMPQQPIMNNQYNPQQGQMQQVFSFTISVFIHNVNYHKTQIKFVFWWRHLICFRVIPLYKWKNC